MQIALQKGGADGKEKCAQIKKGIVKQDEDKALHLPFFGRRKVGAMKIMAS